MALIIYDNGGKTIDRFTAIDTRQKERRERGGWIYAAIGFNEAPFHGFGQHVSAMRGRHLGKRIELSQLNKDCQAFVNSYVSEAANVSNN